MAVGAFYFSMAVSTALLVSLWLLVLLTIYFSMAVKSFCPD
jgi:hypothetical protein